MDALRRSKSWQATSTHGDRDGAVFRTGKNGTLATLVPRLPDLRIRLQPSRIAIRDRGRTVFIDPSEVSAIVAQGNYVLLQRQSGSYCVREPMSVMAGKLESWGFVRIHRSALVNRLWVEEICSDTRGQCMVRLRSGREVTVSRTYRKNLRKLAELWLGNEIFPRE